MSDYLSRFEHKDWCNAATLEERRDWLRRAPATAFDSRLAKRRIEQWRSQNPFRDLFYFDWRLAQDGLDSKEFERLLGLPLQGRFVRPPKTPAWLAALAAVYSRPTDASEDPHFEESTLDFPLAGFLNLVRPLVSAGRERLRSKVGTLARTRSDLPFDEEKIADKVIPNLLDHVLWQLGRTLVLELNVARVRATLRGNTPEKRFEDFSEQLKHRDFAIDILQEYPVLARHVVMSIENWVSSSFEFLTRLSDDWSEIRTVFCLDDDPGTVLAFDGGLGDRHRRGRFVSRVTFDSGFQLFYKPRPLGIDVHFRELLTWLNDRGNSPQFLSPKVLAREAYGWAESIQLQPCNSRDQVQRFFERQGGYLALLYSLEATDFHHENLIAAGEHPVLLDLESLFHQRIGRDLGNGSGAQSSQEAMDDSVLRVGMLPQRLWWNDESDGIDISGLGAAANQLSPDRVAGWKDPGTDVMRYERGIATIPGGNNRPFLNGIEADVAEHAEEIEVGFTNTYELLMKHRKELIAPNGPLERFREDEVRTIIRPTRIYAMMLEDSFHPDLLRDALERERYFDRLWVGIEDRPELAETIEAEREDLLHADIPVFTSRPGSRHLWSSKNRCVRNYFASSAMAVVQRRLEKLSNGDLERQRWFIRASLATLPKTTHDTKRGTRASRSVVRPEEADSDRLLTAARAVGDRLETLALRGGEGASWIGLTARSENYSSLMPLDVDLYSGLPGISMFLAYLGLVSRRNAYTDLAQAALTTLRDSLKHYEGAHPRSVGAFSGWGGVIYTLSHLGFLWKRSDLLREAEAAVEIVRGLIDRDRSLDVVDGVAGCIGGLVSLYNCKPSNATLAAANQCGAHLIHSARKMNFGVGWVRDGQTTPLAGFAHGAAGIAWALMTLFTLTGREQYKTMAIAAIIYERSLFSSTAGNWADHRYDRPQFSMTAWCHGAAGIGLARIRSLPHLDSVEIRAEIDAALKTTLIHGFGGSHCLCHGDLGNIELLIQASQSLNEQVWKPILLARATETLHHIKRHGYQCGVPFGVETPGLMTGLAGIGYGLLRLAAPELVPALLALEPPRASVDGGYH